MMGRYMEIAGSKFELKILKEGFKEPRGPNACTSKCCRHGVYLDPMERDNILAHAELIEKYFDETQRRDRDRWFDNAEEEDVDFPSGRCVSTEVYNDKCVFLDSKGRCVLQVAEMEEGMQRFSLKPYYCVLFPIVKVDGVFRYDDFCSGESACCTSSTESAEKMIEVCSIELRHALGISKYNEVLSYYRNNLMDVRNQNISEDIRSDVSFAGKDVVDAGK
jgi:hypothetical protein